MDLMSLLEKVKGAIYSDPTTPQQPGHDPSGLIGNIEQMFMNHQMQQQQQAAGGNIRPASEDPMGDPANIGGSTAGVGSYGNVRPASEDPLGDPADYERR